MDILCSDTNVFYANDPAYFVCSLTPATHPNPSQFYTVNCSLKQNQIEWLLNDNSLYFEIIPNGGTFYLDHATLIVCGIVQVTYTLTIEVNGNGTITPPVGTHTYQEDEVVEISANPANGWHFDRWVGDVDNPNSTLTTVTMDRNQAVTAYFAKDVPATLRVPQDYQTIQAAIDAAAGGDIVLVADDTYVGSGNKNLDFGGKSITVRSENGPSNCIIDCENDGRGFYFHSGESGNAVLSGFTITNGYYWSFGGGIYCYRSSPTITDCILRANTADSQGGGICCHSASPTITDCTISDNSGGTLGGGIRCSLGSPTIENCTIAGNWAKAGGGFHCNVASPSITKCIFQDNLADNGGAFYFFDYCHPTVSNCVVTRNTANNDGGGVYCDYDSAPTISNCILWVNSPNEITAEIGSNPVVLYSDIQGGFIGTGNIDADPLFVGGSDYHLAAESPCINKGTSEGAPDHDIDGDPRPLGAGYDIGADEYAMPQPDIKANGLDGPVSIPSGNILSVTIELDPGIYAGYQADWWCVADAPFGWYHYDAGSEEWMPGFQVSYQGPLFELIPPSEVLNVSDLPVGGYTFYFGVDGNRNGNLDEPLYYDSVEVNITPP
jgi:hypothetical protein